MMRIINTTFLVIIFLCFHTSITCCQSVAVENDLEFGQIFPGVPKSIDKVSVGNAAEFSVSGTTDAEVEVIFTLPTYMHTTGANMQMIFYETDCSMDSSATPDQSNPLYDDLNPWSTLTYGLNSSGELLIWLGGTVVPGLDQKSGSYTATIVITVTETGN
ncbi:MAG: DUF4402 domain-containing protein [candidate division Zixibacteria bacterium]|nr:DUF4402 domain-containing protein [candidate division Zixibacteria bacterium]